MADLIILEVPEDISARARQIAATDRTARRTVLLDHLKSLQRRYPYCHPIRR